MKQNTLLFECQHELGKKAAILYIQKKFAGFQVGACCTLCVFGSACCSKHANITDTASPEALRCRGPNLSYFFLLSASL